MNGPLGPFTLAMASTGAILAAIVVFTGAAGLSGSLNAAGVLAGAGAIGAAWWLGRRPALGPDDGTAVPRGVRILSTLGALALVVQLVRLTVFIVDVDRVDCSTTPWNAWLV